LASCEVSQAKADAAENEGLREVGGLSSFLFYDLPNLVLLFLVTVAVYVVGALLNPKRDVEESL